MSEKTKVFISWGGSLSNELAEVISNWLPSVLQTVDPFFSSEDIRKGRRWHEEITNQLESTDIGIFCLTSDNLKRPWLLYEAGAISRKKNDGMVCTILFRVNHSEVELPLNSFQYTYFNKKDMLKLVKDINSQLDIPVDRPGQLENTFEKFWPDLQKNINQILDDDTTEPPKDGRTDRELLEEVLGIVRNTSIPLTIEEITERMKMINGPFIPPPNQPIGAYWEQSDHYEKDYDEIGRAMKQNEMDSIQARKRWYDPKHDND